MSQTPREFDVAIIGGGIGGSVLASVLARNNVRVLLIEGSSHPRFAIGESTIPETTFGFRNIARRYGVPELENLATHRSVRRTVSASCGIKRSFSFVYHREGEPMRADECNQFLTFAPPLGPDSHFLRQDVDAYLFHVAVSYGVTAYTHTFVDNLEFDSDGVSIATRDKGSFRASYVVDAGGVKAAIPDLFGLRQEPPYRTRSRTIFTHMVNVKPFDEVAPPRKEHKLISPFHQATLHHFFPGGWFWIIPFDNHANSPSELCSVGVNLDLDRYPRPEGVTPEEEFWQHVARFPSVAAQFERARAVRPYFATDRSQFSSSQVVGDRWCLLPHASDFIDPLFSSGLAVTVSTLNVLAGRLIKAVQTKDFATENFEYLEVWIKRMFRYYDDMVSSSYIAFDDFKLWDAWYRIWTLGTTYGTNSLNEVAIEFEKTKDLAAFERLERRPYRGLQGIDNPAYEHLFDSGVRTMRAYRAGELTRDEAIARIYELLAESKLCPANWHLDDPHNRVPAGSFRPLPNARTLVWGKFFSPPSVRGKYMTGGALVVMRETWEAYADEFRRSRSASRQYVRDLLADWNRDWRNQPALRRFSADRMAAPVPPPPAAVPDAELVKSQM